jgi:glutathione synthase/RimK-type ligase-like ATP-grasp enzyme
MLVQEFINVKREFRILYFKQGECFFYERVKKVGQFCGNLGHGSEPSKVDLDTYQTYIEPMLSKFGDLLNPKSAKII